MDRCRLAIGGLALLLVLGPGSSRCFAQSTSSGGVKYTAAQSDSGREAYNAQCADCHGEELEGLDISPALAGARFDQTWRGKTAATISFHVRRMPPESVGEPGSLGDETYTNILAYILQSNGFAPSEETLPTEMAALAKVKIPRLKGVDYDPDAPVEPSDEQKERLASLPDVTFEMLKNPSPDDWLQWGQSYDGQNFSRLDDINRDTVGELSPAWRTALRIGTSMPTPLVHAGIMFLQTFPDTVLAIDATNGNILWRHRYEPTTGGSSQKMGLGLHGDKVLVPTSDLHVLALDAKTGKLIWDHTIETPVQGRSRAGYQLRSAPFVVGDKVVQGVTSSFVPKGGFILAIDVNSGEEVWRFNTIARPGEPFGNSWNGLPLDKRSGGSVWHQGTYDPELNLIYFGVAPTYDTGPLLHPVDQEGVNSDALYTNCTVALDADTGKLVWHYQHMANDQWDLDWVFERQIVEMPINGTPRKVVMNVGKMAILEALDAATGQYLFSVDPGVQNVITAIDPKTGAKTYDPNKIPDVARPCVISPHAYGARSWPAASYSPETELLYVPVTLTSMLLGKQGIPLLSSGVRIASAQHPDSRDGNFGQLQAFDVAGQKMAWTARQATPIATSLLATAGGVVFSGDLDPSLKAFDAADGRLLWTGKLDDVPSSSLVTYRVDGRQYVAVVVGMRNFHVDGLLLTYREYGGDDAKPRDAVPKGGAAIWAFAVE